MSAVPRPIRLVYCDEEGRFHVDGEAVSILQLVKGPIGVVSVCGPAQQGKSYISNQLLERTSGFQVALSGPGRCTKGLWLWSTPIRKIAADGTEYNILVMDTEGIDGCHHAEEYFLLALVLSSMLIYNEMGFIGGTSYEYLSLTTKMTQMITAYELGQLRPIFVWVLRDFYVHLGGLTPNEHMEKSLMPLENIPEWAEDDKDVVTLNQVRRSIKAVFADRHCFTLVRPSFKERELAVLDQVPVGSLRPEFKKGMEELRSFVCEKTSPKKIGATVMTGPIFVRITRKILDAFNQGKLPMLASLLEDFGKTKRPTALKSATSGTPPSANTRQRKRSIEQMMSSQEPAFVTI